MPREKNKRSVAVAITPSSGMWVGFVTVSPGDRRKRSSAMCADCKLAPEVGCECYRRCEEKLRELEDQVAARKVVRVGRAPTMAAYLSEWLAGKQGDLQHTGWVRYRASVRRAVKADLLGGVLVPDLGTAHIKHAMAVVRAEVSINEANKMHAMLRSALSSYEREHPEVRNMAKLVQPLKLVEREIVPLSVEEAQQIFGVLATRRSRARWLAAIALGLRQGEALGLEWHRDGLPGDVDLAAGMLTVREKQYRRSWEHGCADPHACGERLHRTRPCPDDCTRHHRACPPLCAGSCDRHASTCPQRRNGGLMKGAPKNGKRRVMALPAEVVLALGAWQETQSRERDRAGSKWVDSGRVFTDVFGRPVDARRDWADWKAILTEAGLRDLRVHDARHTAATFNRLLKVDTRVVMALMGWSTPAMANRYEHVVNPMMQAAAEAMNGLLWPAVAPQAEPDPDGTGSATAGATVGGAKILQFRSRSA